MEYAYAVFELLAGLGAFLIGVKLLSDNMEKLATGKMRSLFHRASGKTVLPEGATRKEKFRAKTKEWSSNLAVMVVGLVNAGVMTLTQAATITMGANIGTTITAQIAALSAFDIATFAMGLTGIGVLIAYATKKEKVQTICYAAAGLGLVFVGLDVMDGSMAFFKESQVIVDLFASITNPFLLFFLGIAITAIVQSSSAVTVILISMATQGIIIGGGGNAVMYVVLGTNIGTCVTALLSCIGTSVNARRAAMIHLLFNVIGSIIFFIILAATGGNVGAVVAGAIVLAVCIAIAVFIARKNRFNCPKCGGILTSTGRYRETGDFSAHDDGNKTTVSERVEYEYKCSCGYTKIISMKEKIGTYR